MPINQQRVNAMKEYLKTKSAQPSSTRVEQMKAYLAGKATSTPETPKSTPETKNADSFFGNVFKSAGRFVRDTAIGVGSAIFSPKQTLENIGDPIIGAIGKALPGASTPTQTAKADAIGGYYKERYGGSQNILNSLYNDPVGVLSDVSTLASGFGGASKLAGLPRVANVASKVETITNPINMLSKVASPIANPLASRLSVSAQKQMTQALAPTTKAMKAKAEQVVPGLLQRGTTAMTQESLLAKAADKAEDFGRQIENAWDAIPEGVYRTNIKPVFDDLQKRKISYTVNGVVVDDAAYGAIENMQRKLLAVSNIDASPQSMREFRQILDKGTQRTGKSFALTDADSVVAETRKATANAIRRELGSELPEIDKINKEFSFWSNVEEVMGETIKRKKPQTGLLEPAASLVGLATGSNFLQKILGALALKNFVKLTHSTGWRTISAVNKNKLANLLASGKGKEAATLINNLLNISAMSQRVQRESGE